MKIFKKLIAIVVLVLPAAANAQSYSINWYRVAGGGGTSTNGQYSLSGTIGQHDAGGPMTGGSYSLTSGFWALISVVQTPGTPNLTITFVSPKSVVVSWPDTGNYSLQQNSNLTASAGWRTSGYAITTANGTTPSPSLRPRVICSSALAIPENGWSKGFDI